MGGMPRALLGRFDRILAQDALAGEQLTALGADPERLTRRGLAEGGRGALALRRGRAGAHRPGASAGRPVWLAASTHPGEEEIAHRRPCPRPPGAADAGADPGAAAPGARRRDRRDAARARACRWRSAPRASRSRRTPTSISPTPSARWGSGTASPRSASSAAAWSMSAGTIRSSRRCSAAPSCTGRTCATSSTATGGSRTPTRRCWCARRRELAEALVATMAPDRAAAMAGERLGGLQRGRRGHRRGAGGDRRPASTASADARRRGFWANPPARPGLAGAAARAPRLALGAGGAAAAGARHAGAARRCR